MNVEVWDYTCREQRVNQHFCFCLTNWQSQIRTEVIDKSVGQITITSPYAVWKINVVRANRSRFFVEVIANQFGERWKLKRNRLCAESAEETCENVANGFSELFVGLLPEKSKLGVCETCRVEQSDQDSAVVIKHFRLNCRRELEV